MIVSETLKSNLALEDGYQAMAEMRIEKRRLWSGQKLPLET
jgi:hypothetical protein